MFLIQRISELLPKPLRGLAVRFDSTPIDTVDRLSDFVHTRASYIAQTSLYGYLKTRMGTRFTQHFEDPVFSQTIRAAAVKIFLACIEDLTVHAVARMARSHDLSEHEAAALSALCFERAVRAGLEDTPADMVPPDAHARFAQRISSTRWPEMTDGSAAFTASEAALIEHAPVADELKELDREIVGNSIRLRWRDVREQLDKRLDAQAVDLDWQSDSGPAGA